MNALMLVVYEMIDALCLAGICAFGLLFLLFPGQKWSALFLIALIAWLLFAAIKKGSKAIADPTLALVVNRVLTILLFTVAGITALGIFNVNLSAIITLGGVGGFAVSFAAKDVIANFFGGFMLQVNRPFSIGEWIKLPAKNIEGAVEEIGWYMTTIRTKERHPAYIPNALITDAIVENPGRLDHRRIHISFKLRQEDFDKAKPMIEEIRTMLESQFEIDHDQQCHVHLADFGEIEISCFTTKKDLTSFRQIKQELLLQIFEIIKRNQAGLVKPFLKSSFENLP